MKRKPRKVLWALLSFMSFAGLALRSRGTLAVNDAHEPHVVLISIDGFRPVSYLNPQQFGANVPNLRRLMESGSYAKAVTTIYPSITYPAHATLVTGARPAQHGIDFNQVFDPTNPGHWFAEAKSIKAETLWQAAKKNGLKTAGFFWPTTVGAEMDFLIPVPDVKNLLVVFPEMRRTSTPGLIERVEKRFGYKWETTSIAALDSHMADAAVDVMEKEQPHLLIIHFLESDSQQHGKGLDAPEVKAAYERVDAQIGKLVEATRKAGIAEQTTFIITGDHGFAAVHARVNPNALLKEKGFITVNNDKVQNWQAMAHSEGGSVAVLLKDPKDKSLAARVRALFQEASKNATLFRIIERKELNALGALPTAVFALEAADGYYFGETWDGEFVTTNVGAKGTHGYHPNNRAMDTGFIISGRGAARGKVLERIRQWDVAPTAAKLLGVSLPQSEGKAVTAVLQQSIQRP
jgi:predicted AlkP superfamily pyrophosphatase or phosphodiesterase